LASGRTRSFRTIRIGVCPATRVATIFGAKSFGQRSAAETGDQDSETWADFSDKGTTANLRIGLKLQGIDHFPLTKTMFAKITPNPYAARNTIKPVNFYCAAPTAQSVYLAGDFNGWDPTSHPMRRRADGWWFIEVQLPHGHHQYLFLVDGKPVLDPQGTGIARNERNERVSLLAVS
jgi:hypothetical protein